MTLEEGIEFFEDIARLEYDLVDSYHTDEGVYGREESYHREKAEHHEQVAMWLKELKAHREAWEKVRKGLRDKHRESYFIGVYDAMKIVDKYIPKEGENE